MRNFILLLFSVFFTSCGPSFCDCVWDQTNNDEACQSIYKARLGTEYPSFNRLEAVKEVVRNMEKRLKKD